MAKSDFDIPWCVFEDTLCSIFKQTPKYNNTMTKYCYIFE